MGWDRLTNCAVENEPSDEMYWKKPFWNEFMIMRDNIIPLMFYDTFEKTYKNQEEFQRHLNNHCEISGTHYSKSIKNPAITMTYNRCTITMRYNFYDWNVSIINDFALDFPDKLFNKKTTDCFFQGFKEEYIIHNAYNHNNQKFSCCIRDDYSLYTFMFLLKNQLGELIK
jgi:hypothetical protein